MRQSLVSCVLFGALCCLMSLPAQAWPDSPLQAFEQPAPQDAPAPFAYPAGALAAHPTFSVSPATPAKLGETLVVFEQSLLSDVALIARAPILIDREGGSVRKWVCIQATHGKTPIRLWFISSGEGKVTEAQMEAGSFQAQQQFCGRLPSHFSPVALSLISIGDRVRKIEGNIGPASLKADGWSYWVSRRVYKFDGQRSTEFVWVGARTGKDGKIDRVFASQLTQ